MKTILLLFTFILFQSDLPRRAILDIAKTDLLNASEIADKIIVVPLKNIDLRNPGSEKVFLIDENIFILQRYQEDGIHHSFVLRFDRSGNLKGKLETIDPVSKDTKFIIDMLYDDISKTICLINSNGYGVFDYNGKLVSYNNIKWETRNNHLITAFMFIYKGQFYFEEGLENNGVLDLNLVRSSKDLQVKKIIKTFKSLPASYRGAIPNLSLSSCNDELFVSFKTDNALYKTDKESLTPVFKLEIKNRPSSGPEIIPKQEFIGKYINNTYWIGAVKYNFIYNTGNKKSYNIKYERNKEMNFLSGIKDDYFNTGFFDVNPTNNDDYIYFIKNTAALKGSELYDAKQANPVLFLVKLK